MPLMYKKKESITVHDSQVKNAEKRGWSLEKVTAKKTIKQKNGVEKNGDS
jgi:hypothetical protein